MNITGEFFAFGTFLDRITYGPNGDDYVAAGCVYVIPHLSISCLTLPGTGRVLRWLVTVDGQTSDLSAVSSSYQLPAISSVTPAVSPSIGGGQATLIASGLALLSTTATQSIYLETCYESSVHPRQADIDAYWAALQSGTAPSPALVSSVQPWIASLAAPMINNALPSIGGLGFTIPPGMPGCGGSLWVAVNGVPSSVWTFDYAAPLISNAGKGAVTFGICFYPCVSLTFTLCVLSPCSSRSPRAACESAAPCARWHIVLPQCWMWGGKTFMMWTFARRVCSATSSSFVFPAAT